MKKIVQLSALLMSFANITTNCCEKQIQPNEEKIVIIERELAAEKAQNTMLRQEMGNIYDKYYTNDEEGFTRYRMMPENTENTITQLTVQITDSNERIKKYEKAINGEKKLLTNLLEQS
ncbi:MAG TPA: hypothetical protein VKR54_02570 [Candidatus Babeliales bacterium]|nr:hypothetical protein [Candidatus Babeliales bacterium]